MAYVTQLVKNSKILLNLQKLMVDYAAVVKATSTSVNFEDCTTDSDPELED